MGTYPVFFEIHVECYLSVYYKAGTRVAIQIFRNLGTRTRDEDLNGTKDFVLSFSAQLLLVLATVRTCPATKFPRFSYKMNRPGSSSSARSGQVYEVPLGPQAVMLLRQQV